jgi:hypothetical protein
MPSPAFTFTGNVNKYQATAGGSVVATLSSLSGVSSVSWSIVGTDETSGTYTITTSGTLGSIATITAGAAGTAAILKCTINGGINGLGQPDTSYSTTRKWWVPATGTGLEVACAGENAESSAAFGWTGIVNSSVRNVASGGVTSVTGSAPIVSSGGATPAISITAATSVADGSMSAADKTKVDALLPASIAADQVVITDGSGLLSGTTALTSQQLASATADTFLAVEGSGTYLASAGDVRLSEQCAIKGRNLSDTADASIVAFGINVADTVEIGDSGFDLKAEGLSVGLNAVSSRVELQCAGSAVFAAHPTYIAQSVDTYEFAATTTPTITQASASGNGATLTLSAQSSNASNGNGGAVLVSGGEPNGTGLKGAVRLALGTGTPEPMVEVAELATGRRAVVLGLAAAATTTELPAGTGDRVVYVSNYATAPTANPVSGQLLYSGGHALSMRSTSGVTCDVAPIGTTGGALVTRHFHHQHGAEASTTNTFVTVATITIPASSVCFLTAYLVGKRTDVEGDIVTVYTCASIKRTGAAAPVLSDTHDLRAYEDDPNSAWRWSVVGNDITVDAHGPSGHRYSWSVHITGNIGAL